MGLEGHKLSKIWPVVRQLAKYGFVEDAGPGEDRRERQCARDDHGGGGTTSREAADLRAKWLTLLEPYLRRDDDAAHPDRRHVRYFFAATPLGETR